MWVRTTILRLIHRTRLWHDNKCLDEFRFQLQMVLNSLRNGHLIPQAVSLPATTTDLSSTVTSARLPTDSKFNR